MVISGHRGQSHWTSRSQSQSHRAANVTEVNPMEHLRSQRSILRVITEVSLASHLGVTEVSLKGHLRSQRSVSQVIWGSQRSVSSGIPGHRVVPYGVSVHRVQSHRASQFTGVSLKGHVMSQKFLSQVIQWSHTVHG